MGIFDDIKNAADAHEAPVEAGIDRGGDFVDSRTGGQHAGHVDQAQEFLKDRVGGENAPTTPSESVGPETREV